MGVAIVKDTKAFEIYPTPSEPPGPQQPAAQPVVQVERMGRMRWEKKGVIFRADNHYPWMSHHACVPVADKVDDDVLRSTSGRAIARGEPSRRTSRSRPTIPRRCSTSTIGRFSRRAARRVRRQRRDAVVHRQPGGTKYSSTSGGIGVTVPYRNAVGLAASTDGGVTFNRVFEGPIVDRTRLEPYFCASPFAILDEGKWKLWYASATGFVVVNGEPEPVYQVKYAESLDGCEWVRDNVTCLEYQFDGEANARPCVIKENGVYRMWYASAAAATIAPTSPRATVSDMPSRPTASAGSGWTISSASIGPRKAGTRR